jgi:hypothetical protein
MKPNPESMQVALEAFVSTVNNTGGVVEYLDGTILPRRADKEWIDLGDAYMLACHALGAKPKLEAVLYSN